MGNVSYCRFENTVTDLEDCYNNMENDDLSESEQRARKKLIQLCINLAADYEWELERDNSDV